MQVPAPYQVSVKEDNEESGGGKGSLHPEGAPHTVSGEIKAPSSEDKIEGEADTISPHGKKRAASEAGEVKAPKRGKTPLSGGSGSEGDVVAQFLRKEKPLAES